MSVAAQQIKFPYAFFAIASSFYRANRERDSQINSLLITRKRKEHNSTPSRFRPTVFVFPLVVPYNNVYRGVPNQIKLWEPPTYGFSGVHLGQVSLEPPDRPGGFTFDRLIVELLVRGFDYQRNIHDATAQAAQPLTDTVWCVGRSWRLAGAPQQSTTTRWTDQSVQSSSSSGGGGGAVCVCNGTVVVPLVDLARQVWTTIGRPKAMNHNYYCCKRNPSNPSNTSRRRATLLGTT